MKKIIFLLLVLLAFTASSFSEVKTDSNVLGPVKTEAPTLFVSPYLSDLVVGCLDYNMPAPAINDASDKKCWCQWSITTGTGNELCNRPVTCPGTYCSLHMFVPAY